MKRGYLNRGIKRIILYEKIYCTTAGNRCRRKNSIAMAKLRQCFSNLGFIRVVTYLNSGNIVFSSEEENHLSWQIREAIENRFDLFIPVFIISQEELGKLFQSAPAWWGNENREIGEPKAG